MLTREENELLTRVGPGTMMGNMFRRFWMPACTSAQLGSKPDSDPVRIRLLGENLIAFRDTNGKIGVLEELCMHRGASLAMGRVEDCGIRCIYHGWKYGVDGTVLDIPNISDQRVKEKLKAVSYPVRESGGIIWVYMGPADKQPELPHFPFLDLPEKNRVVLRANVKVNYLQALEGGFDTSHAAILHANLRKEWWKNDPLPDLAQRLAGKLAPDIEIEDTEFGFHYAALREGGMFVSRKAGVNVRIHPFIMPATRMTPYSNGQLTMNFEAPADDEHTSTFRVNFTRGESPIDMKAQMRRSAFDDPRYWKDENGEQTYVANAENRWHQDRDAMRKHESWSGLMGVSTEDAAIMDSMGPIYDRTKEHLVGSDAAIVRLRRKLMEAARLVADGKDPIGWGADLSKVQPYDGDLPESGHWRQCVPGHRVTARPAA
jgi:phenylpropionate dioxygenase-like ring-hydroxylating dioxygenase large terminal subunit